MWGRASGARDGPEAGAPKKPIDCVCQNGSQVCHSGRLEIPMNSCFLFHCPVANNVNNMGQSAHLHD
jgi:hypothetical protein